jgi:DNA-binding LacI/PurR family transcriptional regulator
LEKLAYESVEIAIKNGCRSIALFEETPDKFFTLQIYNYIKAAALEYKVEFKDENFYQGSGSYSGATSVMKPVLKQKNLSFDCIICQNFRTAEEISALIMGRCGLDSEPDMQIVVSRPYPHFNLSIPALYLNGNYENVARVGIELLIDKLTNNSKANNPVQIKV